MVSGPSKEKPWVALRLNLSCTTWFQRSSRIPIHSIYFLLLPQPPTLPIVVLTISQFPRSFLSFFDCLKYSTFPLELIPKSLRPIFFNFLKHLLNMHIFIVQVFFRHLQISQLYQWRLNFLIQKLKCLFWWKGTLERMTWNIRNHYNSGMYRILWSIWDSLWYS